MLAAIHPDTNSLTAMTIPNADVRHKYHDSHFPGLPPMLRFLTPTNVCTTLRTFRTRLFHLERASQSHGALPSAMICYTCLVAKPHSEFRDTQIRDGRDTGGSAAIGRACRECEKENSEKKNGEKENGEKENGEKENGEKENGEKENGEKENGEKENGEKENGEKENGAKENIKGPCIPVSRPVPSHTRLQLPRTRAPYDLEERVRNGSGSRTFASDVYEVRIDVPGLQ
jgi:hypothetical protein